MSDSSYVTRKYRPDQFTIHPLADSAYRTWVDSGPISTKVSVVKLVTKDALADAIKSSPLPVIKTSNSESGAPFGVIGRFNLYYQITVAKPTTITLAILNAKDSREWTKSRIERLCQAMRILEIAGRCGPLAEFSAVWRAASANPWAALVKCKSSLRSMAKALGVSVDQLRQR